MGATFLKQKPVSRRGCDLPHSHDLPGVSICHKVVRDGHDYRFDDLHGWKYMKAVRLQVHVLTDRFKRADLNVPPVGRVDGKPGQHTGESLSLLKTTMV